MHSGLCYRAVSVRPSVTFMYCMETAKHILKRFSQPGCATILVFPHEILRRNFNRVPPCGDVESLWRMKKIAIFDQYLALSRKRYKIGPVTVERQ